MTVTRDEFHPGHPTRGHPYCGHPPVSWETNGLAFQKQERGRVKLNRRLIYYFGCLSLIAFALVTAIVLCLPPWGVRGSCVSPDKEYILAPQEPNRRGVVFRPNHLYLPFFWGEGEMLRTGSVLRCEWPSQSQVIIVVSDDATLINPVNTHDDFACGAHILTRTLSGQVLSD